MDHRPIPLKSESERIAQWIQKVSSHLSEEAREYVKLCFYSDIDYTNYESIKTVMDLFNYLLDNCCDGKEKKALCLFANALKHIGKRLRGHHLVKCLRMYDLEPAASPDSELMLTTEAQFCFCLVKIATKLRGKDIETTLKKHFCRKHYLDMNFRNIGYLPKLFVKLMQRKIIDRANTKLLEEHFKKYQTDNPVYTRCLKYLKWYYYQNQSPFNTENGM